MSVAVFASMPKRRPLLGYSLSFRAHPLEFLEVCVRERGDWVPLQFGARRAFLLSNPDDIEAVLVTQHRKFSKGPALRRSKPLFGNGLLTSEGDFWRQQRKLAQPAFHRERIAAYGGVMVEETQTYIHDWRAGESVDIHHEMMKLTMPIALRTLFGSVLEDGERVSRSLEQAQNTYQKWIHLATMLPDWVPTPTLPTLQRAITEMDGIVYKIIAQRRASGEDKGDLLSLLLRAQDENGGVMTDKQLRDEVLTLFLAGHDTTALTLTWALYLLAQNPDVESKLRDELQTVLNGRPPTVADKPNLPYAEQVIQESMRLYPPAWVLGRTALENCTVGEHEVSAGSTLLMSEWTMHRDARWFPDPTAFRPERWETEQAKQLPRFAYFPFGGGPRICIGSTFALMETVLVLATLLQSWRFELIPNQTVVLQPAVTLRPRDGIQMKLHANRL